MKERKKRIEHPIFIDGAKTEREKKTEQRTAPVHCPPVLRLGMAKEIQKGKIEVEN